MEQSAQILSSKFFIKNSNILFDFFQTRKYFFNCLFEWLIVVVNVLIVRLILFCV